MIPGPACPKCKSPYTETLFVLDYRLQNECLQCRWFFETGEAAEVIHLDAYRQWNEKGEETWL
jgi:hypothetical protein